MTFLKVYACQVVSSSTELPKSFTHSNLWNFWEEKVEEKELDNIHLVIKKNDFSYEIKIFQNSMIFS